MANDSITQLAVFVENRAGRLAEVCQILGNAGINILGFSIADAQDYGVFRLIVVESQKAEKLLKDAGFAVTRRDVICVDVPHCPGGLASVLNILSQANINVEYLYAIANTLIVFNLDNIDKGKAVLKQHNIALKTVNEVES